MSDNNNQNERSASDIDAALGIQETRYVTLAGEQYLVRMITAGALPKLARKTQSVMPDLVRIMRSVNIENVPVDKATAELLNANLIDQPSTSVPDALLGLVANHGVTVFDMVDICLGVYGSTERPDYDQVSIEELTNAVLTIMVVNADFFIRRLLPTVQKALTQTKAQQAEADAASAAQAGPG